MMTQNEFIFWLEGYLEGAEKPDKDLILKKLKTVHEPPRKHSRFTETTIPNHPTWTTPTANDQNKP
jgi:hypothetical protein